MCSSESAVTFAGLRRVPPVMIPLRLSPVPGSATRMAFRGGACGVPASQLDAWQLYNAMAGTRTMPRTHIPWRAPVLGGSPTSHLLRPASIQRDVHPCGAPQRRRHGDPAVSDVSMASLSSRGAWEAQTPGRVWGLGVHEPRARGFLSGKVWAQRGGLTDRDRERGREMGSERERGRERERGTGREWGSGTGKQGTRRRGEKRSQQLQVQAEFREKFLAALEAEKSEELRAFHERVREWPQSRLEAEGYTLFHLIPSLRGRFFKRRIVQFVSSYSNSDSGLLPDHHVFSPGDMVLVSQRHPLEDDLVVEGVVLERARRFLLVVVDADDTELFSAGTRLRLDLAFNAIAYERATGAVTAFSGIEQGEEGEGVLGQGMGEATMGARHAAQSRRNRGRGGESGGEREGRGGGRGGDKEGRGGGRGTSGTSTSVGESLMAMWHLLIGPHMRCPPLLPSGSDRTRKNSGNSETTTLPPGGTPSLSASSRPALSFSSQPPHWGRGRQDSGEYRGKVRGAVKHLVASGRLNQSQGRAVELSLTRRLSLWQGPPGTGKTRTVVSLIAAATGAAGTEGRGSGLPGLGTETPGLEVGLGLGRVLACADSNVAVDNMVEGLLELGVKVVRIGQPVKVKDSLRSSTLEARLACHPSVSRAASIREEAMAMREAARKFNNPTRRAFMAKKATEIWRMAEEVERAAVVDILSNADVVASTCVGSGDPHIQLFVEHCSRRRNQILARPRHAAPPTPLSLKDASAFALCVIDEACQATLPVSLLPLLVSGAHCTVLAGDPQQLPPTVLSLEAQQMGLSKSLYVHIQECGVEPLLLDTQYRMHPALALFPSLSFYGGRLVSFPKAKDRPAPLGFPWPDPARPLAFLCCSGAPEQQRGPNSSKGQSDSRRRGNLKLRGSAVSEAISGLEGSRSRSGLEESTGESASWFNRAEAAVVVRVVRALLEGGDLEGGQRDIGIITPYAGQVKLLTDLLQKEGLFKPQKGGGTQNGGGTPREGEGTPQEGAGAMETLEVKTVDGFQGREKEVIILSLVRSNPQGRLGFVKDMQRMNVSITRAKRGLILVGDEGTLKNDSVWVEWIRQAPRADTPLA